ncbi:MAG: SH3 domain-containing protein [Syntrophothermus sp.]
MNHLMNFRPVVIGAALLFLLVTTGCGGNVPATTAPEASPTQAPATEAATAEVSPTMADMQGATPQATSVSTAVVPVSGGDVLYQDNFTDPSSGWPEDKFDNYFIGYHEPEYYHVEVDSPNYKTAVFDPKKESFGDFTLDLKVLTSSKKTSTTGDFRYGVAFRRSGDQYYAFTISPRSKKWFVLKSTPTSLEVLKEGTDEGIHDLDTDDTLRVDAQGSSFAFHINDRLVEQLTDPDYAQGEIGFYVESFDSPNTHIHFDDLVIRKYEAPVEGEQAFLYQDNFADPASGWPDKKFDNYFIGYHEPEYYHVEVDSPHYKTAVFEPGKQTFGDATMELQAAIASKKTSPEGDFRYGLAFRRSGDQYYAFTISPRAKKWFVLKISPNSLEVLKEGTDASIHDPDTDDTLRVDALGPDFVFHINDQVVGQVTDSSYAKGEVGLYVESFDSPNTHIHFDNLTIRNFEVSVLCNVNALTLYVRNGPGTKFSSSTYLTTGNTVEPVGRTADGQWIKIKLDNGSDQNWVFNTPGFLSCTPSVDLLPVINP